MELIIAVVYVLSPFSHVRLFATPWIVALQAPLSMGFSRQEYWSGFPCPPPGDLPDTGIKPGSLMSPALADELLPPGKPLDATILMLMFCQICFKLGGGISDRTPSFSSLTFI